jgi:hypothetical protein
VRGGCLGRQSETFVCFWFFEPVFYGANGSSPARGLPVFIRHRSRYTPVEVSEIGVSKEDRTPVAGSTTQSFTTKLYSPLRGLSALETILVVGGGTGIRTPDVLLAKQVLYRTELYPLWETLVFFWLDDFPPFCLD